MFKHLPNTALGLLACLTSASAQTLGDRAALQAALIQQIDRSTIDGAFLAVNLKTKSVERLIPAQDHTTTFIWGKLFIVAYTFNDETGQPVEVDFVIARQNNAFVVVQTLTGTREELGSLVASGGARPLDEVLR